MEDIVDTVRMGDAADAEQNKAMGILAYFGILFLIPLLAAPQSRFAKFHANQGLVLFIFGMIVGVIAPVPVIGWFIVLPIGLLFHLVLAIMGIINAAGGKMKPLPLIGGITLLK